MKHAFVAAIVAAITVSAPLHAQTSTSVSNSASQSSAGASASTRSGAYAGGSSSSITFNTPNEQRVVNSGRTQSDVDYSGDYTVRNVPQVSAPSMGSGHPCGLGNSIGISIVGGGATGGATRSDDACLLAQMGHTDAATIMIAARNSSACRALVAAGKISSRSYCGSGNRARVATNAPAAVAPTSAPNAATARLSTASAQPRTIPAGSVTCGSPIKVASWARDRVDNATAIAFCRQ